MEVWDDIWDALDPRLTRQVRARLATSTCRPERFHGKRIALVGQRAAGKTRLLRSVGALAGLATFDLDAEVGLRHARSIKAWVSTDEPGFRSAERRTFTELPAPSVVACGGGFLAHHGAVFEDSAFVLVPVTFDTYRERLLSDAARPRLRPHLSLEQELRTVFDEREALHAQAATVGLADLLAALSIGPP